MRNTPAITPCALPAENARILPLEKQQPFGKPYPTTTSASG